MIDRFIAGVNYPGLDLSHIRDYGGRPALQFDRIPAEVRDRMARLGVPGAR